MSGRAFKIIHGFVSVTFQDYFGLEGQDVSDGIHTLRIHNSRKKEKLFKIIPIEKLWNISLNGKKINYKHQEEKSIWPLKPLML